ncbi:hypothetical protein ACLIR7_08885 [Nitratireductor aquimarinus]|uniref:hypothetical protein n=1 Tax=Nitratireductor aquimarinus TaxID=889300 RepID=UPI00398F32A0
MKERTVRLEFAALEDRHGIIDGLTLARAMIAEAHKLLVPYAGADAPCSEIFDILMGQAFTDNLADGMPSIVMPAEHGLPDYEKRRRAHLDDARDRVAALLAEGREAQRHYWNGER